MTRTAVLIVDYDSGERLRPCVESVRAQEPPPTCLLVIDNASRERSSDRLPDDVRVLRRDGNDGFGAALADGLAATDEPFVLTLNPDTRLMPGCLAAAVAALAADPDLGSVALRVLQAADPARIDACGLGLTSLLGALNRHHGLPDHEVGLEPETVLGPLGGAALWRRAALEQVGGFPAGYFLYWEDVDVALRLQRAGWGCRTVPTARVLHEGSGIVGRWSALNVFCMVRNHWPCLLACLPGPVLRRHPLALGLAPLRAATLYALRGRPLSALAGLLCGLLRVPRALAARRALAALGDDAEAGRRLRPLLAAADADRRLMRAPALAQGASR